MPDPQFNEFDHAIILVRSLDKGREGLRRLGFRPTPPGLHGAGLGTANVTVMMPDRRTYFEALSVVAPTPRNEHKRRKMAVLDDHLYGVAFKGDARVSAGLLEQCGLGSGDAFDFSRDVDLHDGVREAAFSVTQARDDAIEGAWIFVCQHHTPDVVWRSDYLDHPNGAHAVIGLVGTTGNPEVTAESWRPLVGIALRLDGRGVHIATRTAEIAFLDHQAYVDRFGHAPPDGGGDARLHTLIVSVRSLAQCRTTLDAGGLDWLQGSHGDLVVPAVDDLGTTFVFTERAEG